MPEGQPGDLEQLGQAAGQTAGEWAGSELGPSGSWGAGQLGKDVGGALGDGADAVASTFNTGRRTCQVSPTRRTPASPPAPDPGPGASAPGTGGTGGMSVGDHVFDDMMDDQ